MKSAFSKTKKAVLVAVAVFMLFPLFISAASLKDIIKIGVVDMKAVWKEYAKKSRAALQLRKKKAEFARKHREGIKALRKMKQELKEGLSSMSDSEKKRRTAEIEYKRNELLGRISKWNALLAREERRIMIPVAKEIRRVVKSVADTHGVKIVIDKENVVYYDYGKLDLTNAVLRRLRLIMSRRKQY